MQTVAEAENHARRGKSMPISMVQVQGAKYTTQFELIYPAGEDLHRAFIIFFMGHMNLTRKILG